MSKLEIISLFDGIAGARQALKELDIDCNYFASEVDKYAIQIANANHPDIVQMGDVKNFGGSVIEVDLLIGGSPCQDLSIAKQDRKGLKGNRSSLFFEYVRILNQVKPKYFILENVASMSKADKQEITDILGVEPILINSALLTAQQRKRLYWVGKLVDDKYEQVEIEQPEDKGVVLKDIIEDGFVDREKSHAIISSIGRTTHREYFKKNQGQLVFDKAACMVARRINPKTSKRDDYNLSLKKVQYLEVSNTNKSRCLSTVQKDCLLSKKTVGRYKNYTKDDYRKLTVTECERLQGFPDGYCDMVSKTQAYKALGNSFTVPVIKHLLKSILT